MNIILLNGPPGCGKDTVAQMLTKVGVVPVIDKFAMPLRDSVKAVFDIRFDSDLESAKRTDKRVRQFMIWLSEDVVKPLLGDQWFGALCAKRVARRILDRRLENHGLPAQEELVVISDVGFQAETEAFLGTMENIFEGEKLVFQVWQIRREGCSFDGDSRDWVYLEPEQTERLDNFGVTLEQLRDRVVEKYKTLGEENDWS